MSRNVCSMEYLISSTYREEFQYFILVSPWSRLYQYIVFFWIDVQVIVAALHQLPAWLNHMRNFKLQNHFFRVTSNSYTTTIYHNSIGLLLVDILFWYGECYSIMRVLQIFSSYSLLRDILQIVSPPRYPKKHPQLLFLCPPRNCQLIFMEMPFI